MPLNPNISLAYKGIELQNPLDQYGKVMALQSAQQQNALAQRQMQEYDRSLQESEGIRNRLAGGAKIDDAETYNFLLGSKTGREILKQEIDLRKERTLQQKTEGDLFDQRMKLIQNEWGKVRTVEDALRIHYATHADPLINEMLARAGSTEESGRQYILNAAKEGPEAFQNFVRLAQLGAAEFAKLNKPTTMQINRGGQTDLIQVPGMGGAPTTVGAYADVPLPAAVVAQKKEIARESAARTQVNVSTEKKYGERFGGLIAEADAAKLAAAEKAPEAAATADRVMDLIGTGKVITGTGANVRLQIAKALNLAGGTDSEKIRNTEVLISSLAETTLGAIKSSNLGAGQGFTNTDRDFLEKAKAGQLTYDSKSLAELARLSRLAAEKSAESWNKRVQQIPAAALQGTGISTEPIIVPKRSAPAASNIPAAAIQALRAGQGTAEQFDAVFGAGAAARVLKGK